MVAASLIVAASATAARAVPAPRLETVTAAAGMLTLTIAPDGLTPNAVQVATRPVTTPSGAFDPVDVRLRERLPAAPDDATTVWRTHTRLPAGVYFVHVSGVVTGGVPSCLPHPAAACAVRWSNVVRVRVR